MNQDPKQLAIYMARARAVIGLVLVLLPGTATRGWLGGAVDGRAKALARMAGIRDLVLGVGAMTALNETDHGPEWVSMGAAADAVDAFALTFGPGLGWRARLSGLSAAGAAVAGYKISRDLADARVRAELGITE